MEPQTSPKVLFFTGARSEFGHLKPLILEISRLASAEILISGSHIHAGSSTIHEVLNFSESHAIPCHIDESSPDLSDPILLNYLEYLEPLSR